jgi:hypothetical protein
MTGQMVFDLNQLDVVVIFWSCRRQLVLHGCVASLTFFDMDQKLRGSELATMVAESCFTILIVVSQRRVRPMELSDPEHDTRGSRPRHKAFFPSFKEKSVFDRSLIMNIGYIA